MPRDKLKGRDTSGVKVKIKKDKKRTQLPPPEKGGKPKRIRGKYPEYSD